MGAGIWVLAYGRWHMGAGFDRPTALCVGLTGLLARVVIGSLSAVGIPAEPALRAREYLKVH